MQEIVGIVTYPCSYDDNHKRQKSIVPKSEFERTVGTGFRYLSRFIP